MSPEAAPTDAPDSPRKPWHSPLFWLIALAVLLLVAPFTPVPNLFARDIGDAVLVLVYVPLIVGFAFSLARLQLSPLVTGGFLALCALAYFGIEHGMRPVTARFEELLSTSGARPSPIQRLALLYVQTLQDLALIGGASFLGSLLARAVRHPNMIGPVGAALALVDIVGVLFQGPVARMLSNPTTAPLAARAMTGGPVAGPGTPSDALLLAVPGIGVGDFLFLAFFACLLVNFKMNVTLAMRCIGVLVALTLLLVPFVGHLPGLVPIGAGALLPNLKYFAYTRDERFALLWAALLVVVLIAALWLGFRYALPN